MDDVRHDLSISLTLWATDTVTDLVTGSVAQSCAAGNIYDEEANALRLAEQMVRELFRRRRAQLGL